MAALASELDAIMESVRTNLAAKHRAREQALGLCREVIRLSANAIRAIHRGEFERATELVAAGRVRLGEVDEALAAHADIYHAGFVHDAQKEFAEASLTLALVRGHALPSPVDLGVGNAAYLNGIGEAVGELRRSLLDTLRAGDVRRCEGYLEAMDEIYSMLVTVDYPDAMTGGLRRTTDVTRGILEKTRGDLTVAAQQYALEAQLKAFQRRLSGP
jgi:translin